MGTTPLENYLDEIHFTWTNEKVEEEYHAMQDAYPSSADREKMPVAIKLVYSWLGITRSRRRKFAGGIIPRVFASNIHEFVFRSATRDGKLLRFWELTPEDLTDLSRWRPE